MQGFFSNIHSVWQSAGYGSRYVTESINMNRSRSLFGVLAKDAMVGYCAINSTNFVLQNELYQMCWCIRQLATDDVQPPKSVAPRVHRRLSESEVDAVELHRTRPTESALTARARVIEVTDAHGRPRVH